MTRAESDLFLDYSLREAEKLREATAPLASRMRPRTLDETLEALVRPFPISVRRIPNESFV